MTGQESYKLLSRLVKLANSATLSHQSRIKTFVNFLASSFKTESVSVYILDKERRCLGLRISSVGSNERVNCMIPLGEGIAGRCASEKAEIRLGNEHLFVEEVFSGTEETFLALPITEHAVLYGVLVFGLRKGQELAADLNLLCHDATVLLAGIIQGIRIVEDSGRRVSNLTILSELGQLLNKPIPPQTLIPLILQACHTFSGSCCSILRINENNGIAPAVYKKYRSKVRPLLHDLLDLERVAANRVLQSGIPLLTSDIIADEELPPSYVCVPLLFEAKKIGTITFFGKKLDKKRCGNFDEEDRELFESMTMLVSNAIATSASYQQTLQLSQENDKKLKELSLLYRISNTMLSTIRLNKLIHLTLTALTAGANPFFDRAMLFLINERAGVMQGMLGVTCETSEGLITPLEDMGDILASRWDISEDDMIRQRDSEFSAQVKASRLELNRARNVSSRAVLDKKLIHIADVGREKRLDRDFVRRFGITSFAAAPLLAKEQVLGLIIVDNPESGREISRDDLRFLQLFTNQAGMAIENSMLYNRIEDANRKLREAQERLLHGERLAAIGEMAAGIAHELKNPLISIGGFARRLYKKLPVTSNERGHADTIVKEVRRLEKMLEDILSFTRKTPICFAPCTITEIVEDSLAIVMPALEESGVIINKNYPPKSISLAGDCQQLKQVFINLFFNAQEAMKENGELSINIVPTKLNGKNAVSIKIADNGAGIPLESLSSIFKPFYTSKETGTGLGLPIASRIVTNHGGKIQVANRDKGGVEFNVILPLSK